MKVVVGRRPVQELLKHDPKRVLKLHVSATASLDASFKEQLEISEVEIQQLSVEELDSLAEGVRHQGIVAFVAPKIQATLEGIIAKCRTSLRPIVCLDEISDPQNLGSIIRCADAAGVAGVITSSDRSASPSSPVISKASAGANEFVDILTVKNLARTLKVLSKEGCWLYGSALESNASSFYSTEIHDPCVLILGSEGKGLRRQTKSLCDTLVALPMEGVIQSLNVAQATGIMLYELQRRRLTK